MSALVRTLAVQIKAAGLPEPIFEYRFAPPRRWRFDMAWLSAMLACEVDGGVWLRGGGRHTRGAGFIADCTKCNEAVILGWRVLRMTSAHIEDGSALRFIEAALISARSNHKVK